METEREAGGQKELSIYIHIPFCLKKCNYCDFLSFPATEAEREVYLQALLQEIDQQASEYTDYQVKTIFLGGGTPSLLSEQQADAILDRLNLRFPLGNSVEITLEANPGTVDGERLKGYRRVGINRLSIGVQSLQNQELDLLGRIHTATDFYRIYQEARSADFSNINVDIMAALPGQKKAAYRETLLQVSQMKPEHISVYSLMIEEGTPFWKEYGDSAAGRELLPSEEEEREMDAETEYFLESQGYRRYEISNYAKEGWECQHNLAYWKRNNYAGFGLGAASMVQNIRWKNTSSMADYLADAGRGGDLLRCQIQRLSQEEQMEEFMFLGLRLTRGVSIKEFERLFGRTMEQVYGKVIKRLRQQGLVVMDEYLALTSYGRDISNYVMAQFLFS
ncbi:MAG: oxygen-independent coproporphyrinogen III oxidase [Lachnospiraceae bacterium]|nr:oxygen-independent coproporphyrinogen III oxidase [Lachnospiraceae bacterium]